MRFLIDADLPRPTAELLIASGHEAIDVRDIGLGNARDEEIAAYAREHELCLMSGDFGFGDIRQYPPENYKGIVVLVLPRKANRSFILGLVKAFVAHTEVLSRLPGRLAMVESGRIRLRPA